MPHKKHHLIRNLLIPIAIVALGLSAYEYYDKREVTWYKVPVSAFNEVVFKLQSMVRSDEVAPYIIERSQPSDTVRKVREEPRERTDVEIDPRFVEIGESRFELVGRVTKVVDGDSLEVRVTGNEFAIRLHGIDTPENGQPHGREASRALSRKLERRTVLINIVDIDSYGRLVGTVYYQGENINLAMIAEGHGWWYQQYARSEEHLKDAEQAAREAGLGLWSNANPIAPWDWRRAN